MELTPEEEQAISQRAETEARKAVEEGLRRIKAAGLQPTVTLLRAYILDHALPEALASFDLDYHSDSLMKKIHVMEVMPVEHFEELTTDELLLKMKRRISNAMVDDALAEDHSNDEMGTYYRETAQAIRANLANVVIVLKKRGFTDDDIATIEAQAKALGEANKVRRFLLP